MIVFTGMLLIFLVYICFGRPPETDAPARPAVPTWRCTLRNKKTIDVPATSESTAVKALLALSVDVTKIDTLEPL